MRSQTRTKQIVHETIVVRCWEENRTKITRKKERRGNDLVLTHTQSGRVVIRLANAECTTIFGMFYNFSIIFFSFFRLFSRFHCLFESMFLPVQLCVAITLFAVE